MVQPQRSQRVVIALALAGRGADLRDAQFRKAYDRIAGEPEGIRFGLRGAFRVYLDIKPLRSAPKPRLPLQRLGTFVDSHLPWIDSIDLNPVLVTDEGCIAVDALVCMRGKLIE